MKSIITKERPENELSIVTSRDFPKEKIDDILENVKLIYQRNSFTHYVLKVKEKLEKEGKLFYISDLSKICSEHWRKMSEDKKKHIKFYTKKKKKNSKNI